MFGVDGRPQQAVGAISKGFKPRMDVSVVSISEGKYVMLNN
jgi:hypothetical protein